MHLHLRSTLRFAYISILVLTQLLWNASAQAGVPLETDTFIKLLEKVSPAVVTIKVWCDNRDPLSPQDAILPRSHNSAPSKAGSGIVVNKGGVIATNDHVVECRGIRGKRIPPEEILVEFNDGSRHVAEYLGGTTEVDLAVLKIDAPENSAFDPGILGDSTTVRVGEFVLAIGNRLGLGTHATAGIISAIVSSGVYNRRSGESAPPIEYIHTDANIDKGNSGGALVALDGTIIGINTAVLESRGIISVAIPINYLKDLLPRLLAGKPPGNGWIGVLVAEPFPEDYKDFKIPTDTKGIFVTKVTPGSPASNAGMKRSDFVTHVDGISVPTREALVWYIKNSVDKEIRISFYRLGEKKEVSIPVMEKPEQ